MYFTSFPLVSSVVFTSFPLVSSVVFQGECYRPLVDKDGKQVDPSGSSEVQRSWLGKTTLETSGEDVKLHSKRVGKM